MKKKPAILKYLNLYLGSEFYFSTGGAKYHGTVESVTDTGCIGSNFIDAIMFLDEIGPEDEFKLILISPMDMSATQKNKYYSLTKKIGDTIDVDTPESLRYCFSIGVDMFDLIEKGLAVDKKHVTYKKITEKDCEGNDEEITVVEVGAGTVRYADVMPVNVQAKRSDVCGELYELIINQSVIPHIKEENPFPPTHASIWSYSYVKFKHEGIEWNVRKDTRTGQGMNNKYAIGSVVYFLCDGISHMKVPHIKELIERIKKRIEAGVKEPRIEDKATPTTLVPLVSPTESMKPPKDKMPTKKEEVILKRAKYVPDPNWQPPRKFTLND